MSRRFEFFGGDGAIQDLDNGDKGLSPEEFWEQVPERCRLALAQAAPVVLTAWQWSSAEFTRSIRTPWDGADVARVVEHRGSWLPELRISDFEWSSHGFSPCETADDAMAVLDAALRSKGWVLE